MSLKVFDLCCGNGHVFEGWFASEGDFQTQLQDGQLICPLCMDARIERKPSAPRLNLGATEWAPAQPSTAPSTAQHLSVMPTTQQLQRAALQWAREIAAQTEDVGEQFAQEARRIHYQEAPERSIRGVTSKEEAAALIDEGIPIVPLPLGSIVKEPLQ